MQELILRGAGRGQEPQRETSSRGPEPARRFGLLPCVFPQGLSPAKSCSPKLLQRATLECILWLSFSKKEGKSIHLISGTFCGHLGYFVLATRLRLDKQPVLDLILKSSCH